MSRWGDLLTQRGELHSARGHGNVIGFVHRLRQTARVMMGGGIGAHGNVVLLELFCGLSTHWHHSFGFLNGEKYVAVSLSYQEQSSDCSEIYY